VVVLLVGLVHEAAFMARSANRITVVMPDAFIFWTIVGAAWFAMAGSPFAPPVAG